MVREDQVEPAAMDIERFAEKSGRHRRAFDMPTRTPPAPWAFPAGLVRRRLLPEHEIGRVPLVCIDHDTGAGLLLLQVAPGKSAVIRHRGDVEENFAIRYIGVAALDELAN